jgi:hypothetical protein
MGLFALCLRHELVVAQQCPEELLGGRLETFERDGGRPRTLVLGVVGEAFHRGQR